MEQTGEEEETGERGVVVEETGTETQETEEEQVGVQAREVRDGEVGEEGAADAVGEEDGATVEAAAAVNMSVDDGDYGLFESEIGVEGEGDGEGTNNAQQEDEEEEAVQGGGYGDGDAEEEEEENVDQAEDWAAVASGLLPRSMGVIGERVVYRGGC